MWDDTSESIVLDQVQSSPEKKKTFTSGGKRPFDIPSSNKYRHNGFNSTSSSSGQPCRWAPGHIKRVPLLDDISILISKLNESVDELKKKSDKLKSKNKDQQQDEETNELVSDEETENNESKEEERDVKKILKTLIELPRSTGVMLVVDNRENRNQDLVDIFSVLRPEILQTRTLKVGDFLVLLNNKLLFVIERKRTDDLCQSITSGHLRKQTSNMKYIPDLGEERHRCLLLVEKKTPYRDNVCSGCTDIKSTQQKPLNNEEQQVQKNLIDKLGVSTTKCSDDLHWFLGDEGAWDDCMLDRGRLLGSLVNRYVQHGMASILSENDRYTCWWILKLLSTCLRESDLLNERYKNQPDFSIRRFDKMENELTGEGLLEFLTSRELPSMRSELVPDDVSILSMNWINQLLCIDKITPDYAILLVRRFPHPVDFAKYMIENEPQSVVSDLAILVPPISSLNSSSKPQRFGPARAIALYNHFHNTKHTAKPGTAGKPDVVWINGVQPEKVIKPKKDPVPKKPRKQKDPKIEEVVIEEDVVPKVPTSKRVRKQKVDLKEETDVEVAIEKQVFTEKVHLEDVSVLKRTKKRKFDEEQKEEDQVIEKPKIKKKKSQVDENDEIAKVIKGKAKK